MEHDSFLGEYSFSEKTSNLYAALFAFQSKAISVTKDGTNPAYNSKHATIAAVIEGTNSALNEVGLLMLQLPIGGTDSCKILTRITHVESCEWLQFFCTSPLAKKDSQGLKSAITYLRRTTQVTALNLPEEDEDGNEACNKSKNKLSIDGTAEYDGSDKYRNELWDIFKRLGISEDVELMKKTRDFLMGSPMASLEEKARQYINKK